MDPFERGRAQNVWCGGISSAQNRGKTKKEGGGGPVAAAVAAAAIVIP
ncbi:hypothetical protein [Pseudohoeflea coraliihabitans]|uniref:Uncharacterized protein n=1 Tax=Pseudohoeflea coraliihabitans TaxID=2860393 RepID=A0ABS6WS79_9HYPH|nr:hypothetical protein [Pseudohoeflea sp. DP4N28-3]MBW3098809.1 hypothetical protein [Pseudohoeflea sp. DP4N28-3]